MAWRIFENVMVAEKDGTPIFVKTLGTVSSAIECVWGKWASTITTMWSKA